MILAVMVVFPASQDEKPNGDWDWETLLRAAQTRSYMASVGLELHDVEQLGGSKQINLSNCACPIEDQKPGVAMCSNVFHSN